MTEDYTSILDKTDWRKTIHKALEEAVLSIGQDEIFWYNVEQARQAMSATYPNWDASDEVKIMYNTVADKYNKGLEETLLNNKNLAYEWAFPWNKDGIMRTWKNKMYLEILQNLQNIAGRHRMLLWGTKSAPGGTLGPDSGDTDAIWDQSNP